MQIFASSQLDPTDTFLHAGYISAQPLALDLPDKLASLPIIGWLAEPGGILGLTLGAVVLGTAAVGVFWLGRHHPSDGRWWNANVWQLISGPLKRPSQLSPPDS